MKSIPNPTTTYYHVPAWMSIIIAHLRDQGAVALAKHECREGENFYFTASYGPETAKEDVLYVWVVSPDKAMAIMRPILSSSPETLRLIIEEYSKDRKGKEATKVHNGIIALTLFRLAEIEVPRETTIKGDLILVGPLPKESRVKIEGEVKAVNGPIGTLRITGPNRPESLLGTVCQNLPDNSGFEITPATTFTYGSVLGPEGPGERCGCVNRQ